MTEAFLLLGPLTGLRCSGDDYITAPSVAGGPVETNTYIPFLIKETDIFPNPVTSMRYQQVYNASLFANASTGSIYVTTLRFGLADPNPGWSIPSMQMNLSTTSKTATNLSSVFADNVGPDDTVVLVATNFYFPSDNQLILFSRPFKFSPPLGNLLLDVRIYDGTGDPFPPTDPFPQMLAYYSTTDQVARVWSTNVTSTVASDGDTIGLFTVVELSPIPSLSAQFHSVYQTSRTNIITISWPSEPTNFVLQTSQRVGARASWGAVTNHIFGSPGPNYNSEWRIEIPASSAGAGAFYRLIWPGGTGGTNLPGFAVPSAGPSNQGTR